LLREEGNHLLLRGGSRLSIVTERGGDRPGGQAGLPLAIHGVLVSLPLEEGEEEENAVHDVGETKRNTTPNGSSAMKRGRAWGGGKRFVMGKGRNHSGEGNPSLAGGGKGG